MSSKNIKIFDETGCLSEEALMEYAHGKLDIHLRKQVEIHINECDFCRDAAEGISLMKSKDASRAAVAELNEKIAAYGKPERAGGKVIQMYFMRLAAAVLLFFVLGGGVLYVALNPPFKNDVAQNKEEEKVLAENKVKEISSAEVVQDSIIGYTSPVIVELPPAAELESPKEERAEKIISDKKPEKVSEPVAEKNTMLQDNSNKDFSSMTATGGASNAAPTYYNPQYGNAPAPAASTDADYKYDGQYKEVSSSFGSQTKTLSEVEVTTARSESKANDKKAKKENTKNEKAATAMQSETITGAAADDALKVAEERDEVEQARKNVEQDAETQNAEPKVYAFADEMPQYPGGNEALKKYIRDNIKYPQTAKEQAISGTVYISYVVTETGKVTKVKVWKSVSKDLDNEAVRVVSSLQNFTPGKQAGKQVAVQMTIPVKFSLE